MTKKIVITGPESSGKTTLASQLAQEVDAELVEEYAREYLAQLDGEYSFEDVVLMAKKQLSLEGQTTGNPVVLDTDLTVFFIWMKEKYDSVLNWVKQSIAQGENKVYLLCYPLENWEYDPLREHPNFNERLRLFDQYVDLLNQHKLDYHILKGDSAERLKKAKEIVLNYF